jgi:hypothetical protein
MKAHPYFGATYSQNSQYKDLITGEFLKRPVNNYGFISKTNYPYQKKSDEVTLGIFGGSVADQFAVFFENHPLKKKLEDILNKKIRILNMAIGSMKQPQQFIISSYFVESLDLSINIDGFNEITTNQYPFKPVEYPAFDIASVSNSTSTVTSLFFNNLNKNFLLNYTNFISSPILRNSNFLFAVWSMSALRYKKNITTLYEDLKKISVHGKFNPKNMPSEQEILGLETKTWLKYTKLQSQLYKANGIKGFFFLQPNLRVDNSKTFSSIEQNLRKQKYKDLKLNITKRYDYLSKSLRDYNTTALFPIHNLKNIYMNNNETLYTDHCCHLNNLGNEIMAQEIIKTIQASFKN